MEEQNLKERLAQLQRELDHAEELDEESRQRLVDLHEDIERLLERSAGKDEYHRFLSKFQDAYAHFEMSHPTISAAITRVIDGIAAIGI